MSRAPELDRLQRWMQSVITHPNGIVSGMSSEEARGSMEVNTDMLEKIVAPSSTMSGAERLAIYFRSYHARLQLCFQSMFPCLRRALGQELFNRFVIDYLQHHPPQSYTLDHLADDFPDHLARTRPDADAPIYERESWPDFIIELARLELAFVKVYDGSGVEGRRLPDAQDIFQIGVERLLDARIAPVCCLRLFAFRYPVHAYLVAARRGKNMEMPAPAESFVAMTRRNYRVLLHEISSAQYAFLQSLDGHRTADQALDLAARPAELTDWLCDWAAKGFFERVEVPPRSHGFPNV